MLETWLPIIVIGVLCLLSAVWLRAVGRIASKRTRPLFRWMWISTGITTLGVIAWAVVAAINQFG